MMKKNMIKSLATLLFAFLLSLITAHISASSIAPTPDSIGLKTIGGKKYIVHKIDKGESFYSIAKKYNITIKELEEANPDITEKIIAGKILFIPIKDTFEVANKNSKEEAKSKDTIKKSNDFSVKQSNKIDSSTKVKLPINSDPNAIRYVVKGGDYLGIISNKYHTTISNIKSWNNLKTDKINVSQVLIVGFETPSEKVKGETIKEKKISKSPTELKDSSLVILSKTESEKGKKDSLIIKKDSIKKKPEVIKKDSLKKVERASMSADYKAFSATNKPMKEFQEKGIAAWIDDEDVNPRKYFGLHKTAPIGTIIKVTNPMNHHYVFVKVVGTLPDTGDNANLIIKISKASASKLEVLDAHFQAILDYATTEY